MAGLGRALIPLCLTTLLTLLGCGAKDSPPRFEELGRCADWNPTRTAYFGDMHVHTAASLDANLQGTQLRPADAYRFARGEALGIQPYDAEVTAAGPATCAAT
jgi:hypothetical protein